MRFVPERRREAVNKHIYGIHHAAIKCCGVEEFQKTIEFYRDVLGLTVRRSWGTGTEAGAMLDTGAGLVEIFANGQQRLPQGALRHIALAADDVDAVVEAVRAAGYEIQVEPRDIVIDSQPPYPARIAFCIGPVGEQIELFQEK